MFCVKIKTQVDFKFIRNSTNEFQKRGKTNKDFLR